VQVVAKIQTGRNVNKCQHFLGISGGFMMTNDGILGLWKIDIK
jgi:hypothetical protein